MPLQNRVDPFGAIHAVPERGLFTGNRGIIHDPETKTLLKKRWALPAWIICVCEYQGRRREPMGRNRPGGKAGWTELFFLDEPTALAAGHRPCFFCQRARASEFLGCFGEAVAIAQPRAPQVDARLHKERFASSRKPLPPMQAEEIARLPDGAMVAIGGVPFAVRGGVLLRWSFAGYGKPVGIETATGGSTSLALITPATTVAVLAAGFAPIWHASARGDQAP
ncbi:hypothetical protein ACFWXH_21420 [Mesorhizobium sp. NPDC059054]|uniref:hypothetical protein n=1 Tax=Mesorhizobium sp. NPDC059054 TaxID=3346711 RepID=UPI0036BF4200